MKYLQGRRRSVWWGRSLDTLAGAVPVPAYLFTTQTESGDSASLAGVCPWEGCEEVC